MEIVFGVALALLSLFVTRTNRKGRAVIDTKGYTTASWLPLLTPLCTQANVPITFVLAAIDEESEGNPCAIGAPGAIGPDGNPKEMGIFQFYNPDDLKLIGATGAQLRAYCVPTKVQVKDKHGNLVWSHSQSVARLLTPEEMQQQAKGTITKVLEARTEAARYAQAAGVTWAAMSRDFWRLVKLVHGLPGLVHGIVAVAQHLGHPPSSWQEFRSTIEGGFTLDERTEAYRSEYARIFDNAEAATAAMDDSSEVA